MHPRPLLGTTAVLAVAAASFATAAPAYAADSYRYWGYYHLTGSSWAFATKGVAETVPADGAVEGFRYAVGDGTTVRAPRTTTTFDQVCGATPATAGSKRVGVVVDFGRTADARDAAAAIPQPYARCATVPAAADAAQVLAAVAKTRVEAAMLCGIDGYPATGCSDTVKTLSTEAKAEDGTITLTGPTASAAAPSSAAPAQEKQESTGGGSSLGTPALVAIALAAAAGAFALLTRRSRRA